MFYLASPYSADPESLHAEALRATARLIAEGHVIFSPIVHCHPLAQAAELPRDFLFWKHYNFGMLRNASELWVLTLPGWNTSRGVAGEIEFARLCRIPVWRVDPEGLGREPLCRGWVKGELPC